MHCKGKQGRAIIAIFGRRIRQGRLYDYFRSIDRRWERTRTTTMTKTKGKEQDKRKTHCKGKQGRAIIAIFGRRTREGRLYDNFRSIDRRRERTRTMTTRKTRRKEQGERKTHCKGKQGRAIIAIFGRRTRQGRLNDYYRSID